MNQVVFLALCLGAFGSIYAQQSVPKSCADSTRVNATKENVTGEWFAWAYQKDNGKSCVDVDVGVDGETWQINVTYSEQPNPLYQQQKITTNFAQTSVNSGLNVTFHSSTTNQTVGLPTVYKLLKIGPDYSYLLICGYTDETNDTTSYGVILGRERMVNTTYLNNIESEASISYANFPNGTMYQVPQNSSCFTNSAATFTLATTLMAFFCIAIKLL